MNFKNKKVSNSRVSPRNPKNNTTPRQFVSYHSTKVNNPAPSETKRDFKNVASIARNPSKLPIILTMILLLICLIYSSLLSTSPRVIVTKPNNAPTLRKTPDYQSQAEKILSSSFLNKNKFTINTQKLQEQLLSQFPEIQDAELQLPLIGHRPVVELTVRKPALTLTRNNRSILVDYTGKAIADKTSLPAKAVLSIPEIKDQTDIESRVGEQALPRQDVEFITTVYRQLANKKLSVSSITLPPNASELQVKINGQKYYVKFSLLSDPNVAVGQYLALAKTLAAKGIVPKEYIDSRIEERVFYK